MRAFRNPSRLPLALALLCAVASSASGDSVVSADGRTVVFKDVSRIVAIGGAITEILYALGSEGQIVAVDATSQFPPEALKTKANVGYFRALSTEGVIATSPTVIIASDRSGPPEVVKALKASGVPFIEVPDDPDLALLAAKIKLIGAIVGKAETAASLARSVEEKLASLAAEKARIAKPPRVLFVLTVQNGRAVVAGRNTSADIMLALAGATNVATAVEGYKPVGEEAIIAFDPDVIVTVDRGNGLSGTLALKGLAGLKSLRSRDRIVEMDALYLIGMGPRAPDAARDLLRALAGSVNEPASQRTPQ